MITTSRSRIVAYANCQRLGFLTYEWGGTGLERAETALPLATGIAIHEAFAKILLGLPVEAAIADATAAYQATLVERGVRGEDSVEFATLVAEQTWWIQAMIWAWVRTRYVALKRDYDFVAVEKELHWELAPGIVDQIRCDVLARRKSDGGLFYVEWKTTSSGGDEWVRQWEHNTQILANVLAIEEVLGERCEGVIIEGIVRGRRAVDRGTTSPFFGQRIQQSILCYGYRSPHGDLQVAYKSGWRKMAAWETGRTPQQWVDQVLHPEDLETLFAPVPPIRPVRSQLERWRRQTTFSERRIADDLAHLDTLNDLGDIPRTYALDRAFPMNDEHCFRYWGHPCPFEPLCFTEEIERDPIGSGVYRQRVPHHPRLQTDEEGL